MEYRPRAAFGQDRARLGDARTDDSFVVARLVAFDIPRAVLSGSRARSSVGGRGWLGGGRERAVVAARTGPLAESRQPARVPIPCVLRAGSPGGWGPGSFVAPGWGVVAALTGGGGGGWRGVGRGCSWVVGAFRGRL